MAVNVAEPELAAGQRPVATESCFVYCLLYRRETDEKRQNHADGDQDTQDDHHFFGERSLPPAFLSHSLLLRI